MAKNSNRNKHYRIKYCICGPTGYWWQKRKLMPYEEIDKKKNYGTHRYFRTAKLAFRAMKNVPIGSELIRFIRHSKNGHKTESWFKN